MKTNTHGKDYKKVIGRAQDNILTHNICNRITGSTLDRRLWTHIITTDYKKTAYIGLLTPYIVITEQ